MGQAIQQEESDPRNEVPPEQIVAMLRAALEQANYQNLLLQAIVTKERATQTDMLKRIQELEEGESSGS